MESGGDLRPTGDLQIRRVDTASLQSAIDAAVELTSFGRAWLTAVQNPDGSVTTTAHATANYSHRGEQRQCHVAFEVEHDERIEAAFEEALAANISELVRLAMKDGRLCSVAADNNTDIIGGRE